MGDGRCVVVEERDELTARPRDACVARRRETVLLLDEIRERYPRYGPCFGDDRVRQLGRLVVDDHDFESVHRVVLSKRRGKRPSKQSGSSMSADHDGEGRQLELLTEIEDDPFAVAQRSVVATLE